MGLKLIRELTELFELWKISVHVIRRWNLYDKAPPNYVFCVTMVLIDKEVFETTHEIMLFLL